MEDYRTDRAILLNIDRGVERARKERFWLYLTVVACNLILLLEIIDRGS